MQRWGASGKRSSLHQGLVRGGGNSGAAESSVAAGQLNLEAGSYGPRPLARWRGLAQLRQWLVAAVLSAAALQAETSGCRLLEPIVSAGESVPAGWTIQAGVRGEHQVAFSSDGRHLLAGGDDGYVRLIEASGRIVRVMGPLPAGIRQLAWAPESSRAAVLDTSSVIRIYAMPEGTAIARWEWPGAEMSSIAWSSDGERLALGGQGAVRFFEAASGAQVDRIGTWASFDRDFETRRTHAIDHDFPREAVHSLAFSANGEWLAAGTAGAVVVHHLATDCSFVIPRSVTCVAFSPDSRWLAIGHPDGASKLEMATCSLLRALQKTEMVRSVSISRGGTLAAGGAALCYPAEAGDEPLKDIQSLAWSPDGATLAVGHAAGVSLLGRATRHYRFRGEGWLLERASGPPLRGGPIDSFRLVDASGKERPWLPEGAQAGKVEASLSPSAIRVEARAPLPRLIVSARNAGTSTAFDLHLVQNAPRLFLDTDRRSLAPGETGTLAAALHHRGDGPVDDSSTRPAVQVCDAFGPLATFELELDIAAPRPEIVEGSVAVKTVTGPWSPVDTLELTLRNTGRGDTGPIGLQLYAVPSTWPATFVIEKLFQDPRRVRSEERPGLASGASRMPPSAGLRTGCDSASFDAARDERTFETVSEVFELWGSPRVISLGKGESHQLSALLATRRGRVEGEFGLLLRLQDPLDESRVWTLQQKDLRMPRRFWKPGLGIWWAFGAGLLLWYWLLARHPLVRRAVVEPHFLATISLRQLRALDGTFRWSGRLDSILGTAGLDRARWALIVSALETPRALLAAFARATGCTVESLATRCGPGWLMEVTFPQTRASFERRTHLLAIGEVQHLASALEALPGSGILTVGETRLLPVLIAEALPPELRESEQEPTSLGRPLLLDEPRLRAVLMAEDPMKEFLGHT